jgi:hypothetical protein
MADDRYMEQARRITAEWREDKARLDYLQEHFGLLFTLYYDRRNITDLRAAIDKARLLECVHDYRGGIVGACNKCGEWHQCNHFIDDLCVTCGAMA